jgi:predicted MFS family arabinose efflux permease
MGACAYFISARAVFFVTALLTQKAGDVGSRSVVGPLWRSAMRRPLLILAGCVMLFHLANAAMLPLMASVMTMHSSQRATVLIVARIVAPQLLVAALSPWVGSQAQCWGRRPLLLVGFAALPIRGILFATVKDRNILVAVQLLEGVTASVFGVMVPLMIADLTRGTGHFNPGQGIVGTATGIGASLSTTLAGYASDHFGSGPAFLGLAAVAVVALATLWFLMPETRPVPD